MYKILNVLNLESEKERLMLQKVKVELVKN